MSRFGDPHDEPLTFLGVRVLAGMAATVLLGSVVFGDPLPLTLAFGFAVGWAFAGTAYLLRRVADR